MRSIRIFTILGFISLNSSLLAIIPDYGPDTIFSGVGTLGGASAVAVAPNWVITAKHVGGTTVSFDFGTFNAAERIDHPEADISLLRFTSTLSNFYSINYGSMLGQEVSLVGYGGTGTAGATGVTITGGGGVRRKARQVVDDKVSVTFNNIHFFDAWLGDLDGPTGNGSLGGAAVANEGGLWGGDSGGGWLLQNGSSWELVGVNSFIADANNNNSFSDWGDLMGGVALESYENWIQGHIAVPEPASLGILTCALLVLKRRRTSK